MQHLIAYCLNDSCSHQALGETEVLWIQSKVKCGKCGARGRPIDVRPNWKEKSGMPDSWHGHPAWEK